MRRVMTVNQFLLIYDKCEGRMLPTHRMIRRSSCWFKEDHFYVSNKHLHSSHSHLIYDAHANHRSWDDENRFLLQTRDVLETQQTSIRRVNTVTQWPETGKWELSTHVHVCPAESDLHAVWEGTWTHHSEHSHTNTTQHTHTLCFLAAHQAFGLISSSVNENKWTHWHWKSFSGC